MKKRHSVEQIVAKVRQADVDLGKGLTVPEVCKQLDISQQTYYRWRTCSRRSGSTSQMAVRVTTYKTPPHGTHVA